MPSRKTGRALPCPQIARRGGRIAAGAVALGAAGVLAAGAPAAASAQPLLELGSEGVAVAQVQRALGVGDTGYFGPVTRGAVIAFQRRDRLLVDGIVGPQTWGALFGRGEVSTTAPGSSVSEITVSSSSGGYTIPASIVQCESGGSYSAVNPTSGAGGAYQILPSTWQAYGGQGLPEDASPAEQDAIAAKIWAAQGPSAWTCST